MGMSSSVHGFVPPDEEYNKKEKAYWAMKDAGIEIDDDLREFFNWEEPSENGKCVDIPSEAIRNYNGGPNRCAEGYEIILSKLPKNVKIIRFSNSW